MNRYTKFGKLPLLSAQGSDLDMLMDLERETFEYFRYETNLANGLIIDKTENPNVSSISAVGMGICAYVVATLNGYMTRHEAVKRTLSTLKFFHQSHQGKQPDATGYKGFYYHFLDMKTGKRIGDCELSTIDTAILMAGVLMAKSYFNAYEESELQIQSLAEDLYARIDWTWALNRGDTLTHGWTPEKGFLDQRWDKGYSEALILYVLALGSPTFAIEAKGYKQWISTFEWKSLYDISYFFAGPLFIHQLSLTWLDLKNIRDDANRLRGITYFENCRRATYVQQQYAIENPLRFEGYCENSWGFTASHGPGPCFKVINGIKREFFNYIARGVPDGPDDGTISPWAAVASIPFAPEISINCVRHSIEKYDLRNYCKYGFDASFNSTFPERNTNPLAWMSSCQYGLNQGMVLLMIENYRSGMVWDIMMKSVHIIKGLERAGFY